MATIRPVLVAVALLSQVPAAAQQPIPSTRHTITVSEPVKLVLRNRMDLKARCRTKKLVHGCTLFAAEYLSCSCARSGERWQLEPKARFAPFIFLDALRPDALSHEQLHIDDVRQQLTQYLDTLSARSFESESACLSDAAAVSDRAAFTRQMNQFRENSNRKLDAW